jgi:hypothetical protein
MACVPFVYLSKAGGATVTTYTYTVKVDVEDESGYCHALITSEAGEVKVTSSKDLDRLFSNDIGDAIVADVWNSHYGEDAK